MARSRTNARPQDGAGTGRRGQQPHVPREGQEADILVDLRKIFTDPEAWLDLPNEHFMGRTPRELIGTENEAWVRNWIWRVKHGVPT